MEFSWISQWISNVTHGAEATAVPDRSANLTTCVVPKWEAYGSKTKKTVQFINSSLHADIISDGVVLSADTRVNFSTPAYFGGCAWRQFVPAYNKDPAKFPAVAKAINEAIKELGEIKPPDLHGGGGHGCSENPQ